MKRRLKSALWAMPYLVAGYFLLLLLIVVLASWLHSWPHWFDNH